MIIRGLLKGISLSFASGTVGAVAMLFVEWKFSVLAITTSFGVDLAPGLDLSSISQKLLLGGLWGALFAIPILKRSVLIRGVGYSIPPALFHLFVIFPAIGAGYLGFDKGYFTPLFIFFYYLVWGLATGLWRRIVL